MTEEVGAQVAVWVAPLGFNRYGDPWKVKPVGQKCSKCLPVYVPLYPYRPYRRFPPKACLNIFGSCLYDTADVLYCFLQVPGIFSKQKDIKGGAVVNHDLPEPIEDHPSDCHYGPYPYPVVFGFLTVIVTIEYLEIPES